MSKRGKSRKKAKIVDEPDDGKKSLAYEILSPEDTKMLSEIDDIDQFQEKLATVLKMDTHNTELKSSACLDFFVAGFWWGKEQNFTNEQISAFFTVIHNTLENIREKQMTVVDNLKEFKKMLAGIGQDTPEVSGGLDCFGVSHAQIIADYMYTSIFQHYKLYEFMFSTTQAEEIIGTDLDIETPKPADTPWPPPLEEAVAEDVFTQYIATPPATPTTQMTDDGSKDGVGEKESLEASVETKIESDLLAQLSPEVVKEIMDSVFRDMLGGLQTEVAAKLRDKENAYISRINKIYKTAESM